MLWACDVVRGDHWRHAKKACRQSGRAFSVRSYECPKTDKAQMRSSFPQARSGAVEGVFKTERGATVDLGTEWASLPTGGDMLLHVPSQR